MKLQTTWKRLKPDTVLGYKIEVRCVYYSEDEREINAMEKDMMRDIPSGFMLVDLGKIDESEPQESEG